MNRHSVLLMAALMLAGCVPAGPPAGLPGANAPTQGRQSAVIADDRGGNVMAMIQRRNQLERWGGPVEIRDYCGSACTLLITLPNACLAPDATVGFHAPRLPGTTIIPPYVDAIMGYYYRGGVLTRWNREWKHSLEIQRITAAEYVRLDPQTRVCES
ncbi:hypothetical protein GI374_16485 [Paracoccus sp. S-4012]|uniref:hypothetical protein n=1 Tax=Paracoccus sp. S-4012 TaxID=2665648 RepID=UPI0012B036A9|nr:hypothetical protein [Paracoccus sp. S-4012]MRX51983.1 hypothetical protein [Paracoccus sp. S-4012]